MVDWPLRLEGLDDWLLAGYVFCWPLLLVLSLGRGDF